MCSLSCIQQWFRTATLETRGCVFSAILLIIVVTLNSIWPQERSRKKGDPQQLVDDTEEAHILDEETPLTTSDSDVKPHVSSDMSFAEFQLRYLIVYGVAFVGDYIGAAYAFSMFSDYLNLPEATCLHLMHIPYIGTAVATLIISPLVDAHGRRAGFALAMLLFCFRYLVVIPCPPFDPTLASGPSAFLVSLCVISQIMYGLAICLLYTVPECWMVAEHNKRGYPVEYFVSTYSRSYFINAVLGILGVQAARWFRKSSGLLHRSALGAVLGFGGFACALSSLLALLLWTENTGRIAASRRRGELRGDKSEKSGASWGEGFADIPRLLLCALVTIFTSFQIFSVGLGHCLQEAGTWIYIGLWTPTLETKEYENVFSAQLLTQGLGSYVAQLVCRGDDTVASVLGLPEDEDVALVKKVNTDEGRHWGFSIRTVVLLYHVIVLGSLVACAYVSTKVWLLVANLVATFGYGFFYSVYGNLKALVVPAEARVVIVSLFSLPTALVTYFGSHFFAHSKPQALYWLAAIYQGLSMLVILLSSTVIWCRKRQNQNCRQSDVVEE